jgi:hypothetical protein
MHMPCVECMLATTKSSRPIATKVAVRSYPMRALSAGDVNKRSKQTTLLMTVKAVPNFSHAKKPCKECENFQRKICDPRT